MIEQRSNEFTPKIARVAAFVFIGIFLLGITTELFIRPGMIVPGDACGNRQEYCCF